MGKRAKNTERRKPGSRPGQSNLVRLIGGEHGGRKLKFPDGRGLRPTSDRIRETLFNWLQPTLPGAACLDLFAGSGALGLEAASRGAGSVMLLDTNPAVYSQLQQNIQLLCLQDRVSITQEDALHWLTRSSRPFDVVFLDPPFADDCLNRCIELLQDGSWLREGAHIYVERPLGSEEPRMPDCWELTKKKQAGQVIYSLYLS